MFEDALSVASDDAIGIFIRAKGTFYGLLGLIEKFLDGIIECLLGELPLVLGNDAVTCCKR